MKIKKIGNILLTFPLWWENYNTIDDIFSTSENTILGGVIVWETPRAISGKNIELVSGIDGWQTIQTKDAILALVKNSLGTPTTITLIDDTLINVRFRHELTNGAVSFTRVINTNLSEYYECKLHLARI